MPITLLASACPPVQTPGGFSPNSISISGAATSPTAPVSKHYSAGESSTLTGKLNTNAALVDALARAGGGSYGVADGLTLSAGTGLLVAIAPGHIVCDGVVELAAAATVPVPDGQAHVWIWMYRTGLFLAQTALTLPAAPAVLLGSVTTSGGAVTTVDTSGVMVIKGKQAIRFSADAAAPTDTPPASSSFFAVTAGGTYFWNGAAYVTLPPLSAVRTLVTIASQTVIIPQEVSQRIGFNFSGVGQFADVCYEVTANCGNSSVIVQENKGPKTTGKGFLTLYAPGTVGTNTTTTLSVSMKGEGWTGATTAGIAATWDTIAAVG